MKYSDKFFRFPIRLYLTKDLDDMNEQEELLGIKLKRGDPDHVMGWECIDINDICGFGTIFSRGKTIEDVRENGFDCTIVYLKYGKEVGCSWPPQKFEEKLNNFHEKMQESKKKKRWWERFRKQK